MPNLDTFIEIQSPVEAQDSMGQIDVSNNSANWVSYARVWAEVKSVGANEYAGADRKIGAKLRIFIIRHLNGVNFKQRIIYNDEPYDIINIQDFDREGRNHYLHLVASTKS